MGTTDGIEATTTGAAGRATDGGSRSRRATAARVGAAALAAAALAVGGGVAGGRFVAAQSAATSPTAPSNYVAIDAYRAFDSRVDDDGSKPGAGPRPVAIQRSEVGDGRIPSEAVAVAYTITVTATEGDGWAALDGLGGVDGSEISTLAWTGPGQREVNSGIVPTFRGDVEGAHYAYLNIGGGDGAAAHVIIDVVGYLLPADGA